MTPTDDAATKAAREMIESAAWMPKDDKIVRWAATFFRASAEGRQAQPNADAVQIVRNLIASICSDGNSDELRIAQEIVAALRPLPTAAVPPHPTDYQPPAAAVQGHPGHGASVDEVPVGSVEAVARAWRAEEAVWRRRQELPNDLACARAAIAAMPTGETPKLEHTQLTQGDIDKTNDTPTISEIRDQWKQRCLEADLKPTLIRETTSLDGPGAREAAAAVNRAYQLYNGTGDVEGALLWVACALCRVVPSAEAMAWALDEATRLGLVTGRAASIAAMPGATLAAEPTEAMLIAARDWSYKKYGKPIGNEAAIGCWSAMRAAACAPATLADVPAGERVALRLAIEHTLTGCGLVELVRGDMLDALRSFLGRLGAAGGEG